MLENQSSRREILFTGVAGAASTLLAANSRAADPKKAAPLPNSATHEGVKNTGPLPAVIKTSIAAYSFGSELDKPGKPGQMSLFDLTEMAARWQLDGVETTSYYFLKTDDEYLVQLKRKVILAGLTITGTPVGNNFCLKDGPELDKAIAHVKEWVDYSVKLGSPAMRVFAGATPKDMSRDETFNQVIAAMKEVSAYAGQRGVFLTLENHGSFIQTAYDVLQILEGVNSDWLRVNLDTGNFANDPYTQMARLAPHALTCQVKPVVHDKGKTMEPDFQRIISILRKANYHGYATLEYEGKDAHHDVPILLEKIKSAIRATA